MKLTPEMIKKYSYYINGSKNSDIANLQLNDIEKAFCYYCSAIGKLVPMVYTVDYSNKAQYKSLQKLINTATQILEEYAKPYLPSKNDKIKKLSFKKSEFSKKFANTSTASVIADYMPYVVYSEAVQMGYKLDNSSELNSNTVNGELINHSSYYKPDNIVSDINYKIRKSEAYR